MAKKELVMLAESWVDQPIRGMLMSEKLDGMRAWWDGGVSRGIAAADVPYANTNKHDRFVSAPRATGLWSRYGQPIQAPDWFLDAMPTFPCDGELWMGRQRFQETVSIVQAKSSFRDWGGVKYMIFDFPDPSQLFDPREVKVRKDESFFVKRGSGEWVFKRAQTLEINIYHSLSFCENKVVQKLPQMSLPYDEAEAAKTMDEQYTAVLAGGGEGLMLRARGQRWVPERVKGLLKVKPNHDAEATVIGYRFGERGKLCGLIGALECKMPDGKVFHLSGLTDLERQLQGDRGSDVLRFGQHHPGMPVPDIFSSQLFPRGSIVTYRYRELTRDGYPKDPRFYRRLTC